MNTPAPTSDELLQELADLQKEVHDAQSTFDAEVARQTEVLETQLEALENELDEIEDAIEEAVGLPA